MSVLGKIGTVMQYGAMANPQTAAWNYLGGSMLGGSNPFGGVQGKYRQFGTSDEEINRLMAQQQRTSDEANRYQFERGLSALANDAAQRGMGSSGATAAGVPGLQEGIMRQRAQQDLAMQQLAMQMRNARQYVYQPSFFEQAFPAVAQLGGAFIGSGIGAGSAGGGGMGAAMGGGGMPAGYNPRLGGRTRM